MMPVDQRDAWVRAYLEDVFNGHNLQSLDKYMTENLVSHWLGDRSLQGRQACRLELRLGRAAGRGGAHGQRRLAR